MRAPLMYQTRQEALAYAKFATQEQWSWIAGQLSGTVGNAAHPRIVRMDDGERTRPSRSNPANREIVLHGTKFSDASGHVLRIFNRHGLGHASHYLLSALTNLRPCRICGQDETPCVDSVMQPRQRVAGVPRLGMNARSKHARHRIRRHSEASAKGCDPVPSALQAFHQRLPGRRLRFDHKGFQAIVSIAACIKDT